VTGRQRRHRKLLDELKERRGHYHSKKETLDRTMWRARFGRGFGPVVRPTANRMNMLMFLLPGTYRNYYENSKHYKLGSSGSHSFPC